MRNWVRKPGRAGGRVWWNWLSMVLAKTGSYKKYRDKPRRWSRSLTEVRSIVLASLNNPPHSSSPLGNNGKDCRLRNKTQSHVTWTAIRDLIEEGQLVGKGCQKRLWQLSPDIDSCTQDWRITSLVWPSTSPLNLGLTFPPSGKCQTPYIKVNEQSSIPSFLKMFQSSSQSCLSLPPTPQHAHQGHD